MTEKTVQYKAPYWGEFLISTSDIDKVGYAQIATTGSIGSFVGATVPAIATNAYAIDISTNGTLRQVVVSLVNTDSWTVIVGKIQTALRAITTSTETVEILLGKIKVSSALPGSTSSILIAAGTGVAAGGDLLAAITALGVTYAPLVLETPVAGTEGTITIPITTPSNAKVFSHSVYVKTSTGNGKGPFNSVYTPSTGNLVISDIAGGASLANGDLVIVQGVMYK